MLDETADWTEVTVKEAGKLVGTHFIWWRPNSVCNWKDPDSDVALVTAACIKKKS